MCGLTTLSAYLGPKKKEPNQTRVYIPLIEKLVPVVAVT